MISRMSNLLFIHVLREWSRQQPTTAGWLTAAIDPAPSTVLTAIHRDLSHPWFVAQFASIANVLGLRWPSGSLGSSDSHR
jgi:hypothetical protein